MIDVLLYIVAGICFIIGLIGCWPLFEIFGGPIVSFIGLLVLQMTDRYQFTLMQFIIWIVLIVLTFLLPGWIMKFKRKEQKSWWKELIDDFDDLGTKFMIGIGLKIALCCYFIYCAFSAW